MFHFIRKDPAAVPLAGPLAGVALLCICLAITGCGSFAAQGLNAEGVRRFEQAQYQEAIRQFQQASFQDPNNPDAYYNLAAAYHRLGTLDNRQADLAQAERYYNQCLDHAPDHRECHRGLAVLLMQQGRNTEAFRLMQGWVDRSPGVADARVELARLFEETGDRELAKQQLIDALKVDERNPRALAALGRIRERLGENREALLAYQRSLSLDRFQPEVQARLAALQAAVSPTMLTTPGSVPTLASAPQNYVAGGSAPAASSGTLQPPGGWQATSAGTSTAASTPPAASSTTAAPSTAAAPSILAGQPAAASDPPAAKATATAPSANAVPTATSAQPLQNAANPSTIR